jgi:Ca2+-binding RTX toxin-like protein
VSRTALMFVVMAVALVVGSGVALAAVIRCDGGVCEGTKERDKLNGSDARDVMYGFRANDRLRGNGGEDRMFGGSGRDLLRGGHGDDDLYGGPDNDDFFGDAGADFFSGDRGRDRMAGGPGRDRLYGELDDDVIASQDGVFDVVDCGPGNYDAVVIDRGLDNVRDCENVYWQENRLPSIRVGP